MPIKVKCEVCDKKSALISKALSVCKDCILARFEEALPYIKKIHRESRSEYSLPPYPPLNGEVKCKICANQCKISEGKKGFCGIRVNEDGKLKNLVGDEAIVECYYDPLPTNCVASWTCPGGSNVGYPKYSYSKGVEYGYKNLAVFYGACTFNCLFCQNWHYRNLTKSLKPTMSAEKLASFVDEKTSCICFFGGDPTPQIHHAIKTSRLALNRGNKVIRICWETNGSMTLSFLKTIAKLSMGSGGCIKFDLKVWHEELNVALCGVSNKQTLKNFEWLANLDTHMDYPFLVASTLLIPGYIDIQEVKKISSFIASLDPNIPYSLLAFYPHFYMDDLPFTSKEVALECLKTAKNAGLKNVRIGNVHLLQ